MKKTLMLAAILVVGTSMTAIAEENIASQRLNETVISTENFGTSVLDTAKNVTIVTQEDIQNKGANTVAEALRGVPGLVVSYMDGGSPTFDMRGQGATASANVLVLLDGVPLNGIGGNYDTNQIPVDLIEKIEVVPSGGAVMYGDGTVSGVINIITKAPRDKTNYGSVGLEAGSWGTRKGTLNYGTKLNEKLLFDISYSNYTSEEYRSKPEAYDKDDTRESIWMRGRYLLEDGYLEARYSYTDLEDYYTGYLEEDEKDDPKQTGKQSGGKILTKTNEYTLTFNKKLNNKWTILMYGDYIKREGSSNWYSKNDSEQYYTKAQLKYSYWDDSYIIIGGDYKNGKAESLSLPSAWVPNPTISEKTKETYAGYILNKTTVGDFQFTQGYRREKNTYENKDGVGYKKDFKDDAFELAANYLYSDTGSIYLSFTQSFRTPHIWDLNTTNLSEFDVQDTKVYEAGIKEIFGNTYISASTFIMDTENEIYYDKPDPAKAANKNFDGKVRRIGTQLAFQHYFDKLTLRENVSYIQPKIKTGKYSGNEFGGVARWNINIGATYNFTSNFMVNGDMYYLSGAYNQDDFANKGGRDGDYTIFNVNTRYRFNTGLEIYAGIRNLFDEKYFNAVISSYSSGNLTREVYYPADGRSFYAGFKYNF